MGKDDYFNMALFGNSPRERRIGSLLTTALSWSASTGGELQTFELHVSPLQKERVVELSKEKIENLEPYINEVSKWIDDHPSNWSLQQIREEIAPKYESNLKRDSEISDLLTSEKEKVFDDIAGRFKDLMVNLFSGSYLIMESQNYGIMRKLQEDNPQLKDDADLNKHIEQYGDKLIGIGQRYAKEPNSPEILAELRDLEEFMNSNIAGRLREEHGINADFKYDTFAGRMGSAYLDGEDQFFKVFDKRTSADLKSRDNVSFHFNGMLEGQYKLDPLSDLLFKEQISEEHKKMNSMQKYNMARLSSPIHFRIQLPDVFGPIVQKVFDSVSQDYSGRIVSHSELVPYKS